MESTATLKINRLVLAIVVTFIVADTAPHPKLSPGIVDSTATHLATLLSNMNAGK